MVAAKKEAEADYLAYVAAKSTWLWRIAFLLCQDVHRADDLVQSTVTKLYVHWSKVASATNPDGYARMTLVNCFLAEQRTTWWRRIRVQEVPTELPAPTGADPDVSLDLRDALAAVPPRQRTTLVLRFYCDLSVQETAELMRCSTGNVKSQTSRGLAALRRILDDSSMREDAKEYRS